MDRASRRSTPAEGVLWRWEGGPTVQGWHRTAWNTMSLAPSLQGVITVKGLLDREKGDFYTLTVVADDGGPKVDSTVVSGSPGASPRRVQPVTAPRPPNPYLCQPPNLQEGSG